VDIIAQQVMTVFLKQARHLAGERKKSAMPPNIQRANEREPKG